MDAFQIRIYFKLKIFIFLKKAFIVSRVNLYQLDQLTIAMQKNLIIYYLLVLKMLQLYIFIKYWHYLLEQEGGLEPQKLVKEHN